MVSPSAQPIRRGDNRGQQAQEFTMQHKSLIYALTKAGAVITADDDRGGHFFASKGAKEIEWYTQRGFDDKASKFVDDKPSVSICFTRSKHTDSMTDCFCDTFHRNIKSAVAAVA